MIYTVLFMAQSFACLIVCFLCFCYGVRCGRISSGGGIPHVPNPISAIKDSVEAKKEHQKEQEIADGIEAALSVSRESMMKSLETERSKRDGRG